MSSPRRKVVNLAKLPLRRRRTWIKIWVLKTMSNSTAVVIFSHACQPTTETLDEGGTPVTTDQGSLGLRKVIHNHSMKVLKDFVEGHRQRS
jgi:hypothetical protein